MLIETSCTLDILLFIQCWTHLLHMIQGGIERFLDCTCCDDTMWQLRIGHCVTHCSEACQVGMQFGALLPTFSLYIQFYNLVSGSFCDHYEGWQIHATILHQILCEVWQLCYQDPWNALQVSGKHSLDHTQIFFWSDTHISRSVKCLFKISLQGDQSPAKCHEMWKKFMNSFMRTVAEQSISFFK